MDSKIVNAEIKRRIWPVLRMAGFAQFSSRTAWRHHPDRIDVLNFQSYNAYNAEVMGCTTYSFNVSLGCFFKAIASDYEPHKIKIKAGQLLPQEAECHFRGKLSRTFKQAEFKARTVWYIDPKGRYLEQAIGDVESLISSKALPWFAAFADQAYPIDVLLNSDEDMTELWGFGRKECAVRHYFIGYLAAQAGRVDLARHHLSLAVASGYFKQVEKRLVAAIERADTTRASDA